MRDRKPFTGIFKGIFTLVLIAILFTIPIFDSSNHSYTERVNGNNIKMASEPNPRSILDYLMLIPDLLDDLDDTFNNLATH